MVKLSHNKQPSPRSCRAQHKGKRQTRSAQSTRGVELREITTCSANSTPRVPPLFFWILGCLCTPTPNSTTCTSPCSAPRPHIHTYTSQNFTYLICRQKSPTLTSLARLRLVRQFVQIFSGTAPAMLWEVSTRPLNRLSPLILTRYFAGAIDFKFLESGET